MAKVEGGPKIGFPEFEDQEWTKTNPNCQTHLFGLFTYS